MAEVKEDKEIMELLNRLKKMGGEEEQKAAEKAAISAEPKEKAKEAAAAPAPKKPRKGSLYAQVLQIEEDIKSKEELIDEDFKKLAGLLQTLDEREASLLKGEGEVKEKESVLNAKLEEIRKIKEELKKIIA